MPEDPDNTPPPWLWPLCEAEHQLTGTYLECHLSPMHVGMHFDTYRKLWWSTHIVDELT